MAQFPLALSIEPRLLPLAVANGFHMDSKVRHYSLDIYSGIYAHLSRAYSIVISSSARCSKKFQ